MVSCPVCTLQRAPYNGVPSSLEGRIDDTYHDQIDASLTGGNNVRDSATRESGGGQDLTRAWESASRGELGL